MGTDTGATPGFKDLNRADLDKLAPDYGINPADFAKVDDLRAALVATHEQRVAGDTSDAEASKAADPDSEIERLKTQLEQLKAQLNDANAGEKSSSPKESIPSVEDVLVISATNDRPWITVDMTGQVI